MGPFICGRLITEGKAFLGIVFEEEFKYKKNIKITHTCRSLDVLVVRWSNCGLEKTGILCSFSVCFRVVFVCVWTTIIMFKCTCIKCDTVLPVNRTFDTLPFNSDPSFILYAIST